MAAQLSDEIFLCTVCREIYDEPKILPCGHTVCLKCIQGIAKMSNQALAHRCGCPHCRFIFDIPSGGLQRLQTNYSLTLWMKKYTKISSAKQLRAVCGKIKISNFFIRYFVDELRKSELFFSEEKLDGCSAHEQSDIIVDWLLKVNKEVAFDIFIRTLWKTNQGAFADLLAGGPIGPTVDMSHSHQLNLPQTFKEAFSGKRLELTGMMDLNHGLLIGLLDNELITIPQLDTIKSNAINMDRCFELLTILERGDGSKLVNFLELLIGTNQKHVADFILGFPSEKVITTGQQRSDRALLRVHAEQRGAGLDLQLIGKMFSEVLSHLKPNLVPLIPDCLRDAQFSANYSKVSEVLLDIGYEPHFVQLMSAFCANLLDHSVEMLGASPAGKMVMFLLRKSSDAVNIVNNMIQSGWQRALRRHYLIGDSTPDVLDRRRRRTGGLGSTAATPS